MGFVALQAGFSQVNLCPQFDATLLCHEGLSLGSLLERGFGLLEPNFLDADFLKMIHLGSLSTNSILNGVKEGEYTPHVAG